MRSSMIVALGCAALAAGCGGGEARRAEAPDPFAHTRDSSCYTVDLFTQVAIVPPRSEVPEGWRAFSGRWGGGKWDGEWCHDLYVLSIEPDGAVQLVETYAPHEGWGKRATAYTRRARIDRDGRLRLRYGGTELVYWVEGDTLYGERIEGNGAGRMIIAMERRSA